MQRAGIWDPISSFLQAPSGSLVRRASAHGVLSQKSVSLPLLTIRRSTESGPAPPHGSVVVCEAKKAWGGDEPPRSTTRRNSVILGGSSDLAGLSRSRVTLAGRSVPDRSLRIAPDETPPSLEAIPIRQRSACSWMSGQSYHTLAPQRSTRSRLCPRPLGAGRRGAPSGMQQGQVLPAPYPDRNEQDARIAG